MTLTSFISEQRFDTRKPHTFFKRATNARYGRACEAVKDLFLATCV